MSKWYESEFNFWEIAHQESLSEPDGKRTVGESGPELVRLKEAGS